MNYVLLIYFLSNGYFTGATTIPDFKTLADCEKSGLEAKTVIVIPNTEIKFNCIGRAK